MSEADVTPDGAIAALYGGPIEEFVRRRDALAKELRSAGDRSGAAMVKALRKPTRIAWALDLGVNASPEAVTALEEAVAGTLDAHAAGGNVRAAMAALRSAVRDLAGAAGSAATRAGARVDTASLSSALLAVIARPDAFAELRAGRLAEVPDAGALDFLSGMPAPAATTPAVAAETPEPAAAGDEAARERSRAVAAALERARSRVEEAQVVLRDAETHVAAAELAVREAEAGLAAARRRHEDARRAADVATQALHDAEADVRSAAVRQQAIQRGR